MSPSNEVEGQAPQDRPSTHDFSSHASSYTHNRTVDLTAQTAETSVAAASRQVSWWSVHEFVTAVLAQANVGPLAYAGTPAWCELADSDPRKLLALALDGEHHVLRKEVAQAAMAEASRAISAAADWSDISREIQRLSDFRATRPWAKREAS